MVQKACKEHLKLEGVDILLRGIRKGLKKGALMAILSFGRMVTILCCLTKWNLTFKEMVEGLCSGAV
jgi:hypothetical protein